MLIASTYYREPGRIVIKRLLKGSEWRIQQLGSTLTEGQASQYHSGLIAHSHSTCKVVPMLILMFSFVAGIVATLTAIRLYPVLKNSPLADLVIIAVHNRWASGLTTSFPQAASEQTQAEKRRAMAASPRTQ